MCVLTNPHARREQDMAFPQWARFQQQSYPGIVYTFAAKGHKEYYTVTDDSAQQVFITDGMVYYESEPEPEGADDMVAQVAELQARLANVNAESQRLTVTNQVAQAEESIKISETLSQQIAALKGGEFDVFQAGAVVKPERLNEFKGNIQLKTVSSLYHCSLRVSFIVNGSRLFCPVRFLPQSVLCLPAWPHVSLGQGRRDSHDVTTEAGAAPHLEN